MSNEDTTVAQEDAQQDLEQDLTETENQTDVQDEEKSKDPLDNIEDVETLRAEAKKFRGIANRKATSKPQPVKQETVKQEVQPTNNAPTFVTQEQLDESILRTAKGYDDKALDQLKAIAKGKGITLTQAQEDDLFISYIERQKEEKRKTDAKLGASKGSGRTPKVDTTKPMTAEEHKAYWKEKMGR